MHGTDKYAHGYIGAYQEHFYSMRTGKLNILEIGVGGYDKPQDGGESLRMWRDYFAKSTIYGVDIYDKSPLQEKRIKIFKGSQNDPHFLQFVAKKIGSIDIIIDDGSHFNEHVVNSFHTLFPFLSNNGYYVIEDLHSSYWPHFGGNWRNLNDPSTSMATCKNLVDGLNYQYIPNRTNLYTDGNIKSVHFYPKIVFIAKGKNRSELPQYIKKEMEMARK
jgi:demethylmacrocin O-methyltransferase